MEIIELKKHSSLIAISNRNITVPQRKLYNAILYLSAKQLHEDSNRNIFKLKFSDVVKFSGYAEFSNTKYLKDSIRELVETIVEYNLLGKDKQQEWGIFALLSQATIKEYEEHITVAFPPVILDNLSVPNIYALLNLSIVNSLSGKYSLPIYELLADYKKVRKISIPIDSLRQILGISENEYNSISNFKIKVLLPSITEISELTDLSVSYELSKIDSRSYTHITFTIKDKSTDLDPVEYSAYHLLTSKGLQYSTAKKFAKLLSKQNILVAVEHLEKAIKHGSVKNVAAYLTKILKTLDPDKDTTSAIKPNLQEYVIADEIKSSPKNDIEFKKYLSNKIHTIISSISLNEFTEFISLQNKFSINHYISKNILDESNQIINISELSNDRVFKGWIENKYIDEELEYKLYLEQLEDTKE